MDTVADYEGWKVLAGKTIPTGDNQASAKELATMYAFVTGRPEPPISIVLIEPDIFRKAIADHQAASKGSPLLEAWLANGPTAAPSASTTMIGWAFPVFILGVIVVAVYRNRHKLEPALVLALVVFLHISRSVYRFGQRVIRQAREGLNEKP